MTPMQILRICLWAMLWTAIDTSAMPVFRASPNNRPIIQASNVYQKETRQELAVTTAPWSAVGLVVGPTGQKCSGALVARDIVLTAGHCLFNKETGQVIEGTYSFFAGYNRGNWRGHSLVIAKHYDRFALTVPDQDWALLRLNRPLGDAYSWFQVKYMNGLSLAYGALNVFLLGYASDLLQMEAPYWQTGCSFREKLPFREEVTHDCNMSPGASGSPMMVWDPYAKAYQIVAVNIAERRNGAEKSLHGVPFSSVVANIAVPSSQFFSLLEAMIIDPKF